MSAMGEYLTTVPEPERKALEHVGQVVRRIVPGVEEGTSYGLPAFMYRDRPLLGFKASKNHLSVFPFSPEAVDAAREALEGFDLSKGTVRFTADKPIPDEALEQILHARMREIEGS